MLATVAVGATGCSLTEAKDKAALVAALAEFESEVGAPGRRPSQSTDESATVISDGTPVATAIKEGLAGDRRRMAVGGRKGQEGRRGRRGRG